MHLPEGWSEARVRSHLAINRHNLVDERAYLVKTVREATERLADIEKQLNDIDQSVELLNSEHSR